MMGTPDIGSEPKPLATVHPKKKKQVSDFAKPKETLSKEEKGDAEVVSSKGKEVGRR